MAIMHRLRRFREKVRNMLGNCWRSSADVKGARDDVRKFTLAGGMINFIKNRKKGNKQQ